jgi:hypothetical protein
MSNTINMRTFGLKMIAGVAIAGTVTIAMGDSAQALSLNGGFVMNGTADVIDAGTNSPTIKFTNFTIANKTGSFIGLSGTPVIADLVLTDPNPINTVFAGTFANLSVTDFISGLILGGGLTFDLDASTLSLFGTIANANDFFIAGPVTGVFKQGGSLVGKGFLGINNNDGISSISLRAESTPIPTPALLPGLLGIGIAAVRKRKQTAGQSKTATA